MEERELEQHGEDMHDSIPDMQDAEADRNLLHLLQTEISVSKEKYNKFGGFSYRSCVDIFEAIKPYLKEYNATIEVSDRVEQCGDQIYVISKVTLVDKHGKAWSSEGLARETMVKPKMGSEQLTGCASSYARKYALQGLLLLDDSVDPDSVDNSEPKNSFTPPAQGGFQQ